MKTLIVPMAGRSSRYPRLRPKWMLTHPMSNTFMGIAAILGLNLEFFDKIYFTALQEHEDKYMFKQGFLQELLLHNLLEKSEVILLEKETKSQSETVYKLIEERSIQGFIFIKDSDGYFECEIHDELNQVAYFDLNDMDDINARSKSYVELDSNGLLTNIVEKRVISSTFSCGGYGFASASNFVSIYNNIEGHEGECYVSHIIFEMMLSGTKFFGLKSSNFKDWGTIDAWNKYKSQYKCLFVDIDGTLVTNSSCHFHPYLGEGTPLLGNIELLRELYSSGKAKIILTTSRPKIYEELTLKELKENDIPFDELIMGLPHSQRIIINDFARSNPYPSCSAINIPRDQNMLKEFF